MSQPEPGIDWADIAVERYAAGYDAGMRAGRLEGLIFGMSISGAVLCVIVFCYAWMNR